MSLLSNQKIIPKTFSKMTGSGIHKSIQKGQATEYILRPQIMNEHNQFHSNIIETVDATTIVGQIFKASKDNINSITVPMGSAESVVFDTFEGYADSGELQAVWVEDTNVATLETSIVATGSTKSMKLPLDTLGDTWTKTIAKSDFTDYNGVFDIYQTKEFNKAKIAIELEDSTGNKKALEIAISEKEQWEHFDIPEKALVEDSGNSTDTDMTDIIKVRFKVTDKEGGQSAYIDNYYATPPPGDIELKLWDFGDTLPVAGTSDLDDATQYEEIGDRAQGTVSSSLVVTLYGGIRNYHLDGFVAGVAKGETGNTPLTIGNYYAITFHHTDTEVNIYGNGGDTYSNGFAFTAPNTSTAITDLSKDIGFGIFSTQAAYIVRALWGLHDSDHGSAKPGDRANMSIVSSDLNYKIKDTLFNHIYAPASIDRDISGNPLYIIDGGHLTLYYEDDFSDNVQDLVFNMQYKYKNPTTND